MGLTPSAKQIRPRLPLTGMILGGWLLACMTVPGQAAEEESAGDYMAEPNIRVTLRDDMAVVVDIYRPPGPGPYPTLYAAGPFPHNRDQNLPETRAAGPVGWYLDQGYAVVFASTRGTGQSEGDYAFLSREEQQDHYEVVEWIAGQEWSNGRVGGYGAGYYATSQWMSAIQNPPALSCIAPYNGVVDPYREWAYPGGIADNEFTFEWYDRQVRQANAFPSTGPARLVAHDLRLAQLSHPLYDDYWRLRAPLGSLDKITIPVFTLRSWAPEIPGGPATLRSLGRLESLNKLLVTGDGPGQELYADPEFHREELLPFYEWCLNDSESTTFIERPRIRFFVQGAGRIKRESSWPPSNVDHTPLLLHRRPSEAVDDETLAGELLGSREAGGISNSQYGLDTGIASVRFTSPPLERDVEITGPLLAELFVSSTAADTAFEIVLLEEITHRRIAGETEGLPSFLRPEAGSELNLLTATSTETVSRGRLKASLRNVDESMGTEFNPWYPFEDPRPLTPNNVYRLRIALDPTAYRLRRGNRLVVEVRRAQDGSLAGMPARDTIHHSEQYPSRLWLPVVQLVSSSTDGGAIPFAPEPENTPEESLPGGESPIIYVPPGEAPAEND